MPVESKAVSTPITESMRDAAVKRQLVKRVGESRLRITPGHREAIALKRSLKRSGSRRQ